MASKEELKRLLDGQVSLLDVVSTPTTPRPEAQPNTSFTQERSEELGRVVIHPETDDDDFDDPEPEPTSQRQRPTAESEEPYDAAKNARSLVFALQSLDAIILNPIALVKTMSNCGGNKAVKEMKAAHQKTFRGVELDDVEKRLVDSYKKYQSDLMAMSDAVLSSEDETKHLIEVATDYCEETKMKVGPGMAFWSNYAGSMAKKITLILMK